MTNDNCPEHGDVFKRRIQPTTDDGWNVVESLGPGVLGQGLTIVRPVDEIAGGVEVETTSLLAAYDLVSETAPAPESLYASGHAWIA